MYAESVVIFTSTNRTNCLSSGQCLEQQTKPLYYSENQLCDINLHLYSLLKVGSSELTCKEQTPSLIIRIIILIKHCFPDSVLQKNVWSYRNKYKCISLYYESYHILVHKCLNFLNETFK